MTFSVKTTTTNSANSAMLRTSSTTTRTRASSSSISSSSPAQASMSQRYQCAISPAIAIMSTALARNVSAAGTATTTTKSTRTTPRRSITSIGTVVRTALAAAPLRTKTTDINNKYTRRNHLRDGDGAIAAVAQMSSAKRPIAKTTKITTPATTTARWIVYAFLTVSAATGLIAPATAVASAEIATKEAYFNGSAYLRLLAPMPIWDHSAISFRSCRGGEILAQQYNKNSFVISVLNDFLQISLAGPAVIGPNNRLDVKLSFHLLDNRWHTLQFKYEYGNLYLYVDRTTMIFANATYNSQFLTNQDIGNEAAILILGNSFAGCLLDGPGLQFVNGSMTVQNVVFGACPLTTGVCGDHDTLMVRAGQDNYCTNDPCMGHGLCISHADAYECRCTARYAGKNCQIDNGSPCTAKGPCANAATCIEDSRGDYQCLCTPNHTGRHCETEVNLHPLCQATPPCLNGGACVVAHGSAKTECECAKGYAGVRCEIDVDECATHPCQNGGRCTDIVNGYTCDCHGTGYTGAQCQFNVDECEMSPCLNGGRCFDTYGWYTCQCQDGWGGEVCEKPISCQTQQCLNGGTCVDKKVGFECRCLPGYSGELCQQGPLCPQCPIDSECVGGKCICKPGSSVGDLLDLEIALNDAPSPTPRTPLTAPSATNSIEIFGAVPTTTQCLGPIGHCVPITPATIVPATPNAPDVASTASSPVDVGATATAVATMSQSRSAQMNACSSEKCLNGGTCSGYASNFTCYCASGYTGFNCEVAANAGTNSSGGASPSSIALVGGGCHNGGTASINGTHCYCPAGYTGERCEKVVPCSVANCLEPMVCALNKCICPEGRVCTTCASQPCRNGGVCKDLGNGDYECKCNTFWTGRNCMQDIDECMLQPNICGNGICKNEEGGYKCYCTPGFTGIHCDSDVDECLSHPCMNGATCNNKINAYECICPSGYSGFDCDHDINECESNPCSVGSTCINMINNFTCACIAGMQGRYCEIDIDDCISAPCQHGGRCIDQLGGFLCDCTSTGYEGSLCQSNIDECASNKCTNGAECIDKVNDYACNCFPGFAGKNCEIDINECESNPCQYNGTCLERSNLTLYSLSQSIDLPQIFSEPFAFNKASGYECVCVAGIMGKNCEININECESNPCSKHGTCNDGIGTYTCECDPGFEGTHCEINIDECERYDPCGAHGTCIDQTNDYECDCDADYGGKNCSVPLLGCLTSPCLNGGFCRPFLVNETEHLFNCSCSHGFQGDKCEKTTTISMVVKSLITVKTQREEGYDINLQFKTTLPNGVLAFGTSGGQNEPVSYILELINGRLNLHSSLLNKWEGVFIGSKLNDSNWHKVFVAINTSHLVLSANDEQAIFPVGSYETANGSQPSFPLTYLGGTIPNLKSYLRHLTHRPSSFVGCMQDIVVNGKWIFPEEQADDADTTLAHIQSGCPRTVQCNPNPCHSNGECTDLWYTFACTCQRPHFGHTCKYNITAATFGHENTTRSAVIVETNDVARRAIRSILDISMFIRTRQPTGQIFYLGSDPRRPPKGASDSGASYVAAQLAGGELLVRMQFNGTPESYTVGGNKLDNGYNHLIEVVRNMTLVQVKLNGTEYFRKTLSSTGLLDAQVLYLGGPPPAIEPQVITQATSGSAGSELNVVTIEEHLTGSKDDLADKDFFKGIIQDVKVSNGSHTMIVELYPLNEEDLGLPLPFGEVTIDRNSVLKGAVSDDLCRKNPCRHNAECRNTWNDYVCKCPNGYKGKDCQEIEFCQLVTCPGDSLCQNLDDGYECLTNITFTGNEKTPLAFYYYHEPLPPLTVEDPTKSLLQPVIEIAYRTRAGGTLLFIENVENFFEIGVIQGQVTVGWKLNHELLGETKRFTKDNPDHSLVNMLHEPGWNRIYLRAKNGKLEGGWKGWESMVDPSPAFSADIDQIAFQELISSTTQVYLGGMPTDSRQSRGTTTFAQQGSKFKGCLGEARVGDRLLPYFSNAEMYPGTENVSVHPQSQFRLNSTRPEEGCILCFQADCKNGGNCRLPSEQYACECPPGYEGDDCAVDIDECLTTSCANNATCIDKVADFECSCLPGYDGRLCENNIDECASQPCHNGGNCTDLIAAFYCDCTEEFAGPQCDVQKQVTCENLPCRNGSTCDDGFNANTGHNFTCSCMDGFEGALCDVPFCEATPCHNGGLCITTDPMTPLCQCSLGYTGRLCETDIDECESGPCKNGGQCADLIGDYECNCTDTGYVGVNCETDIDECAMSVEYCGGLGRCINLPGTFKCICQDAFCGAFCNFTDPCKRGVVVCMNGGTCVEACGDNADYYCNCTDGYTGKNCTALIQAKDDGPSTADIAIIVIPVVVVLLLIGAALLGTFLVMARNKRATRGTYSPSAQEYCNPRLEMDSVLKPPPEERLI